MNNQSLSESRALLELYFSNLYKSREHQKCAVNDIMQEIVAANIDKYNLIMEKINKLMNRTVIFE